MVTIAIIDKDIVFTKISDQDALLQRIQNRVMLWKGEWFLSVENGLDWFSIVGAKATTDYIQSLIKAEIRKDELVTGVLRVDVVKIDSLEKSMQYNKPLRTALIGFTVNTVYGELRGFV